MTAKLAHSVNAAADLLDCSPSHIRRSVAAGELRSIRLLNKTLIPQVEIERVLGMEHTARPNAAELIQAFADLVTPNE